MENTNIFFLYRHIRPNTNEVFYIGIGRYQKKWKYSRAYSSKNRNPHWHNIVKSNNGMYKSEILFDEMTELVIKDKEKEFIKLYGRSDLKLGTLCNLTDGGEGTYNLAKESRQKISIKLSGENNNMFGKTHNQEWKDNMRVKMSGENNPNYKKPLPEWHKEINRQAQLGRKQSHQRIEARCSKMRKPVVDLTTEIVYASIRDIAKTYNVHETTISRWITGSKHNLKFA